MGRDSALAVAAVVAGKVAAAAVAVLRSAPMAWASNNTYSRVKKHRSLVMAAPVLFAFLG